MNTFPLNDSRWKELKSGYRITYDARPLIQRFASGSENQACWNEVWDELHHQGDVDTAAYATLPHLISIYEKREVDPYLFHFAATVASEAGERDNPLVPDFLRNSYNEGLDHLFERGLVGLKSKLTLVNVRMILAFLACQRGARILSWAIRDIDVFDLYGGQIIEAEQNEQT